MSVGGGEALKGKVVKRQGGEMITLTIHTSRFTFYELLINVLSHVSKYQNSA